MLVKVPQRWLGATGGHSVFRRLVAAILVVALCTVAVVHAIQHYESPAIATASQSGISAADERPEQPKQTLLIDHCFGSTVIAVRTTARIILSLTASSDPPAVEAAYVRAYTPDTETRPPIV